MLIYKKIVCFLAIGLLMSCSEVALAQSEIQLTNDLATVKGIPATANLYCTYYDGQNQSFNCSPNGPYLGGSAVPKSIDCPNTGINSGSGFVPFLKCISSTTGASGSFGDQSCNTTGSSVACSNPTPWYPMPPPSLNNR